MGLNNALGELEGRLSDAENAALKGGKTAMAKLEGKIRELEAELASTQSRTGEAAKAFQRAERKAKELSFAQVRTRRTRTACLSSPPSSRARSRPTSSRSRRQRRSPPSTWPSSARPSRSLRRPRSAPSSPWFSKLMLQFTSQ